MWEVARWRDVRRRRVGGSSIMAEIQIRVMEWSNSYEGQRMNEMKLCTQKWFGIWNCR